MYRICPDCGAYLDPGEICDCKEKAAPDESDPEAAQTKEFHESIPENQIIVKEDEHGQIHFVPPFGGFGK